jgi:prepilin-type N-terminal cleavage/methylation domain-containing protein
MIHYPFKGFTLVETLVAITVLLLVVVGPMTITARTTKSSSFAAEQVVAHFLAQEGLEIAQRARDEELLIYYEELLTDPTPAHEPWAAFTSATGRYNHCYSATGCGLFINNAGAIGSPVANCGGADSCRLHLSTDPDDRSRYSYSGSALTRTPYTRVIKFIPDGDWVEVTSEVTWRTGSLLATQRVLLKTHLVNVYGLD